MPALTPTWRSPAVPTLEWYGRSCDSRGWCWSRKASRQLGVVPGVGAHAHEVAEVGEQAAKGDAGTAAGLELLWRCPGKQHEGDDSGSSIRRPFTKKAAKPDSRPSFSRTPSISIGILPYAMTTSGVPVSTTAPLLTAICATVPPLVATTSFSIFMASRISSTSPSATCWLQYFINFFIEIFIKINNFLYYSIIFIIST